MRQKVGNRKCKYEADKHEKRIKYYKSEQSIYE